MDDILALNNDIHPVALSLNKTNIDNKECPFINPSIHIDNYKLSTKIYNNTFLFVNYPFKAVASHCHLYISQLVRLARSYSCNNDSDFNEINIYLTKKSLHQGFRYHEHVRTSTPLFQPIQGTDSQIKMYLKRMNT